MTKNKGKNYEKDPNQTRNKKLKDSTFECNN